jgi:Protein of unknown function, DUF547
VTCRPSCAAAALAVLALWPLALHAAPKFSYEDWNRVLGKYVDARGSVNYDALAKDRGDLDRFLAAIEKTSPRSSPELFASKNDQLAYWLNAYNAQVFKGVLARGPERESVWKGGLFSGYSFFVGMDIVLGGEKLNLKKLEDKTVREGFKDPRIHAALNCASKGCPRLPQVAFDPEKLDEQLDDGMRGFVAEKRNVAVDDAAKTVTLSKIFDWFSGDFVAYEKAHGNPGGNQIDYVNRYRGSLPKVPRDYKVKFLEYDKGVNKQ